MKPSPEQMEMIHRLTNALRRYRNFYFGLGFALGAFAGMGVTLLVI